MCGICGVHDTRGVDQRDLARMVDALRHRGPDDSGTHIDGKIGLGHRRLSIIDLDTGHQPISNEDRTLWITFNGEIYNYRELARRLEPRHQFRTSSDTEVILHLYEEEGPDCLRSLRGMFAFAIYDSVNDRVFAARDHLGQKPFYYSVSDGRFCFASEIKSLLALDPGLRELDGEALCEYLALRIITPPRSMFRRIRKLPPAHCITYARGEVRVERYWDLEFEPKLEIDFDGAVRELESRLLSSVEYHLVSDVPVGAFLSGGLDSSLVLAAMSRFTDSPIKTFTGDLPYGGRSELPYARAVSDRFGTESHELTISPSLVEELPSVIWHLDEPSDPLSTCLYSLSRFTRREVKVVLGGDGGDELFGGYDRYYGYRYAGYLRLLPAALRRQVLSLLSDRLPGSGWYRGRGHQVSWLLHMSLHEDSRRYAKSLRYFYFSDGYFDDLFPNDFRKSIAMFDPEENIRQHFDARNTRDVVDRMLYADAFTRLPDHPVMILDRMTMAHGLEARSPFLDHELAEFCAKLPPSFKIRGTRRRLIQTALAETHLPRKVIKRQKQGFSSAFTYMMAAQFNALYDRFLKHSSLLRDGYLQSEPIQRLLESHISGRSDHGQRLWLLCNCELWYRIFIEAQPVENVREEMRAALGTDEEGTASSGDRAVARV